MEQNKSQNGNRSNPSNIWIGPIFIGGGAIVLLNQLGILPTQPI